MNESNAVEVLSALSQETRLGIVRYLISRGEEGAAAGEVAAKVGAQASKASFHLSYLEKAGVVSSERVSRKIIYRADLDKIGGTISFLLNDCCGCHPKIMACCVGGEHSCCD